MTSTRWRWLQNVRAGAALLGLWLSMLVAAANAQSPIAEESLTTAREKARTMHSLYAATLEVMHDRYFHGERAVVPARALEDVFDEIKRQSKVESRWISVNTKPMSVDHEPKSPFEKQAAKELGAGKEAFERVEDGAYLRAAPIPLHGGCISCHSGFFAQGPTSPRYAGLIIRVPLKE